MWRLFITFQLFSGTCSIDLRSPFDEKLHDAAAEIISTSFGSAVTINFVVSLNDEINRNKRDFINSLAQRCNVILIEDVENITPRQRLFNVIFIEDFQSFLHFSSRLSSKNFVSHGHFLFVFVGERIQEIDEMAKRLWTLFIYNVDFLLTAEDGTKLLMTFFPFSELNNGNEHERRCDDTKAVIIRNFSKDALMWKGKYFPEKVSDLSQCPVKVVTFNCPPMMMIKYQNDSVDFKGPDGEMLKSLSSLLNFKIDLIHISDLVR